MDTVTYQQENSKEWSALVEKIGSDLPVVGVPDGAFLLVIDRYDMQLVEVVLQRFEGIDPQRIADYALVLSEHLQTRSQYWRVHFIVSDHLADTKHGDFVWLMVDRHGVDGTRGMYRAEKFRSVQDLFAAFWGRDFPEFRLKSGVG